MFRLCLPWRFINRCEHASFLYSSCNHQRVIAFLMYSNACSTGLARAQNSQKHLHHIRYLNQFSLVVFKRQHYVFHIFTGYTFVCQFPVPHFPPPVMLSVIFLSCKFSAPTTSTLRTVYIRNICCVQ